MSRHHKAAGWASESKKARPRIAATLPQPCIECGRPVLPGQPFDVAHRHDLARGGDAKVYGPAHQHCNRSKGGKLGAAMSRSPRTIKARPTREVKW